MNGLNELRTENALHKALPFQPLALLLFLFLLLPPLLLRCLCFIVGRM